MKRFIYLFIFTIFLFIGIDYVKAAEISDGTYVIRSALNYNMVVDVANAKTDDGTNVHLYQDNNSDAQKWEVKHIGNGYYTISTKLDNTKVLDVKYGGYQNGTNIQLHTSNNSPAQQWLIKYAGNGYYYIISKCNNKYVDIANGSSKNGANIQMYQGNGSNAQKFKFVEVIDLDTKPIIEDGSYTISSFLDNSKVLDIQNGTIASGINVQLYDYNKSWAQIWSVKSLGNGYYSILNAFDNKQSLDVRNASAVNGSRIQIYNNNGTSAQKWIIKDAGDGYFYIISQLDNLYVDIANGSSKNGAAAQLYHGNGTNAQKFKFNKVDAKKLNDGYYTIRSLMDNNKVIGLNSNVANNLSNVALQVNNGHNSNKWYVKNIGGIYYSITNAMDRSKSLDVRNASKANGANVQVYSSNNTDAQKWIIQYNADGSYNIVSKNGGLVVDLANAGTIEGTNVQMWSGNGTDAQAFEFVPANLSIENGYYSINLALDNSKVLDVNGGIKKNGTYVQVYSSNKSNAQLWKFEHIAYDYYKITSAMNPNISLDVAGGGTTSGSKIQVYKSNSSDAQIWQVKENRDGTISIASKKSGLNIDVTGGSAANGNRLQLYTPTDSINQKFKLTKHTEEKVFTGMDVSVHQYDIDWSTVAASDLGFVVIRAGYGGDINPAEQDDRYFLTNVKACEENNIPYAVYLYSYASNYGNDYTSAASEAKHVLRLLNSIGDKSNFTGHVFFDMEDKSQANLSVDTRTRIVDGFCSIVENNGYKCGLYSDQTKLQSWFNTKLLASKYDIWVAQWPGVHTFNEAKSRRSSYNLTDYKIWQFSNNGTINGVSTRVDLNLGYDIFD